MKSISQFTRPDELCLTGNLHTNWKSFKDYYAIYAKATKGDQEDAEIQVAQFLALAGRDAIQVYSTFTLTAAEQKDLKKVMAKFEEYCNPRKNIVYERYLFYTRCQHEGEPFDHFLNEITRLVKNCDFADQENAMLRDRIVLGIADQELQVKLLNIDNLDLKKAKETCRVAEITDAQAKVLQRKHPNEVAGVSRMQVDNSNSNNFTKNDKKKFTNTIRNKNFFANKETVNNSKINNISH